MGSPETQVADVGAAVGTDGQAFSAVLDANSAETLVVPGGDFLLTADYVREGPDLLLISPDGTQVLIRDFFSGDAAPDLFTEFGARITGALAETLAGPEFPGQYAQAAPGEIQPIGQIEVAEGDVFATRADGTRVALGVGDSVFQGDVLETSGNGTVGLVFVDDTTFSLGADGRMVLDELVFDPGTNEGTSSFNIVQGVFSFVSGRIASSGAEQMTVSTPVVTIGIRGTQVAGVAAAEGQENTVTLLPDANGVVGELSITNGAGVSFVLNQPNQSIQATSFNAPISEPVIFTDAQVNNLFGTALAVLPPSPAAAGGPDAGGEAAGEGEGGIAV